MLAPLALKVSLLMGLVRLLSLVWDLHMETVALNTDTVAQHLPTVERGVKQHRENAHQGQLQAALRSCRLPQVS